MADFVIRRRDAKVTTVEKWRSALNDRLIPEAQAHLLIHTKKDLDDAQADYKSFRIYLTLKDSKDRTVEEDVLVTNYEQKPLSDNRKLEIYEHLSHAKHTQYYDEIINVESVKTDIAKTVELKAIEDTVYKLCDVVEVFEHGRMAEPQTIDAAHWILRISGITKAQADKYMESNRDVNDNLITKRKYHFRFNGFPLSLRNELQVNNWADVEWADVKGYLRNKATGLDEN